ncbi:hypothetical protein IMSAGC013_01519 [Lachnospiraceae bacterium]|nr:hypothetical protein IMSAGC013_01519 [Lachnospiraceae bacterium]
MKQKFLFEECPKQQCNELDNEAFKKMENFYNSSYRSSFVNKRIFDIACSVDKTLLTLIVGSLTSLSINLATSVIDLDEVNYNAEFVFRILQFIFAVGFNIYTICFTARVINIQECGEKYYPNQKISENLINEAQKNVMFNACIENESKLKKFLFRGGICIIVVILSVPFRSICVEAINQIILFLGEVCNNIKNFLGV